MTMGGTADVFLSYKREDEARVARIVKALVDEGLPVWWDRGLPGGEEWRANIEAALDAAKVVVVCWTRASVGPEGGFVRDEASRAGARLVPLLLERGVRPPLGFGELQAVDLSHWNGNARDPFFQDLVGLITARRDGKTAPKPKGPAARALRRFVFGGGLATAALAVVGFLWSTPLARETVCALPVAQPGLSRTCCSVGFTEKQILRNEAFTPAPIEKSGYLKQAAQSFPSENAAKADAQVRLAEDAKMLCAVSDQAFELLTGAEPQITRHNCSQIAGAWYCSADYRVTCAVERRELVERCPG
jgi:hypothetical protein